MTLTLGGAEAYRVGLTLFSCPTILVLMKNMTITLDEEAARWARVWAAEHDTSVSRMVGNLLRERMREEDEYGRAMKSYLSRHSSKLKEQHGYPSREALHER